jgi:hypothetical protein
VTTPAGVEAQVATGALVVVGVGFVGVGVTTGVGVGVAGSGGGVPDHSMQYSLPTSRAEHLAPGLKLRNWASEIPQLSAKVAQLSPS